MKKQIATLKTLVVKILRKINSPLTWFEQTPALDEAHVKFAFFNAP